MCRILPDVGGEDVRRAVVPAQPRHELRPDLSKAPRYHDPLHCEDTSIQDLISDLSIGQRRDVLRCYILYFKRTPHTASLNALNVSPIFYIYRIMTKKVLRAEQVWMSYEV